MNLSSESMERSSPPSSSLLPRIDRDQTDCVIMMNDRNNARGSSQRAMDDGMDTDGDLKKLSGKSELRSEETKSSSLGKAAPSKRKAVHNPSGDKTGGTRRHARKKWKKPKGKPNRPLSAYNLFFQAQRALMLGDDAKVFEQDKGKKRVHRKTHGKIGFADMAKVIGQKWKDLPEDEKKPFIQQAAKEKERYNVELEAWKEEQKKKPKAKKSLVAALRAESAAAELEGAPSVQAEYDEGLARGGDSDSVRLQRMAEEINQRNMALLQQRSENEYLMALHQRRMALLGSQSAGMFQQYPSAAESSANALLSQYQPGFSGASLPGRPAMGRNPLGMGINQMSLNSMNMNSFNGGMNIMNPAEIQRANRMQQLRAGFGAHIGDLRGIQNMGSELDNSRNGDVSRLEHLNPDVARHFLNRFI